MLKWFRKIWERYPMKYNIIEATKYMLGGHTVESRRGVFRSSKGNLATDVDFTEITRMYIMKFDKEAGFWHPYMITFEDINESYIVHGE